MFLPLGSRLTANLPLADYLKTATGHFGALELPTDPKHLSPYFTYTASQKSAIRIYQKRFQFRLSLHAPFIDIRLGALNLEERQLSIIKMLNAMQLASDLEIELITFHPCSLEADCPEKFAENFCYEEDSLAFLLREAKKLGVTLLLENMPQLSRFHRSNCDGTRFDELLWLFPETNFGVTIDLGHALQSKVSLKSLLKIDRIRHFHLHDNDRIGDSRRPIESNLIWWHKLLVTLKKNFPEAVGILEMNRLADQLKSMQSLTHPVGKNARPFSNANLEELTELHRSNNNS